MITWGIVGAGKIAGSLVEAIRATGEGEVRAIGSRSADRAAAFAEAFAIPASYGSYDALLSDPSIDVVYVATTNDLHHRNTLDAIAAGKAVLCEKPFALNARQGAEMAAAAASAGVFLMEAMWMRFIPAIDEVVGMATRGDLGQVQGILADFGFASGAAAGHRLVEPGLGGGALLDLGVYPISLAMLVLGEPGEVSSQAVVGESGVDEQVAVAMRFAGGSLASVYASYLAASPLQAHVIGTEAQVHLPTPMHHPRHLDVVREGERTRLSFPYPGTGYQFEVAEVHRALQAGETESRRRPLADTLAVMKVLDAVRSQIGVGYPGE